jgi:hypothetical protein
MVLLASHAYRIPQYRFVIDLFDKGVLRRIVLGEDESESSEEEGESESPEEEEDDDDDDDDDSVRQE